MAPEEATGGFLQRKVFLKVSNFTGKHLCWSLFLIRDSIQVFSSEICEIFKNTFFEEQLQTTVSETPEVYKGTCIRIFDALRDLVPSVQF